MAFQNIQIICYFMILKMIFQSSKKLHSSEESNALKTAFLAKTNIPNINVSLFLTHNEAYECCKFEQNVQLCFDPV